MHALLLIPLVFRLVEATGVQNFKSFDGYMHLLRVDENFVDLEKMDDMIRLDTCLISYNV